VEPLLINTDCEYIESVAIPGIRLFREPERQAPFDIYFCKTKYNVYQIMMGLDRTAVEARMAARSHQDQALIRANAGPGAGEAGTAARPSEAAAPQRPANERPPKLKLST